MKVHTTHRPENKPWTITTTIRRENRCTGRTEKYDARHQQRSENIARFHNQGEDAIHDDPREEHATRETPHVQKNRPNTDDGDADDAEKQESATCKYAPVLWVSFWLLCRQVLGSLMELGPQEQKRWGGEMYIKKCNYWT